MTPTIRGVQQRTVHAWDAFVLFWVVLWLAMGVWTGVTLWQASDAGDTISTSGEALHSAGKALQGFSDVPLVGDGPKDLGDKVMATGDDVAQRGQLVRGQLRRLAVLLGLSIVFIPITPVAGFYVPVRLSWRRQVRSVAAALRERPDDPRLDAYLAERARASLPVQDVLAVHEGTSDEQAARRLADLELARLGLARRT